jgi:hypothetical protein
MKMIQSFAQWKGPERCDDVEGRRSLTVLPGAFVGFVAGVIAIWEYLQTPHTSHDISGEWDVTNVTRETTYSPFQGLAVGYRLFLHQNGTELSGNGEKVSEGGRAIPAHQRTPLSITGGEIRGDKIAATFTDQGTKRSTTGEFVWTLHGERRFSGSFTSTAASSRGTSDGQKIVAH